jgi:ubiquinone/menaquinone biosynthesis C-methylase UbiE
LQDVVEAVAPKIRPEDAPTILDRIIAAFSFTYGTSKLEALVEAIRVLAPSVTASQLTAVMRAFCHAYKSYDEQLDTALGRAIEALEPRMGSPESPLVLAMAKSRLAEKGRVDVVEQWTRVLEQVLREIPNRDYANQVVDILK